MKAARLEFAESTSVRSDETAATPIFPVASTSMPCIVVSPGVVPPSVKNVLQASSKINTMMKIKLAFAF